VRLGILDELPSQTRSVRILHCLSSQYFTDPSSTSKTCNSVLQTRACSSKRSFVHDDIMSAQKRVATTAIDWAKFALAVPKEEVPSFNALKGRNDQYRVRLSSLPGELPKVRCARARIYECRSILPHSNEQCRRWQAQSMSSPASMRPSKSTTQMRRTNWQQLTRKARRR
jgi:hypothetical protein